MRAVGKRATLWPIELGIDEIVGLIATAVREQRCILFLGAGVHAPPPDGSPFEYPAARRPPIGAALSLELAEDCGLAKRFPEENPRNLQRVALFYQLARSRSQLVDAVHKAVALAKQPSPMLNALAELDFPVVITTNYDQLYETALAAAGKQPRVAVYTPHRETTANYRQPSPQSPIIYKIHGDIAHTDTIVITDEDYIKFVLRMNSKEPYDPIPLSLKFYLTDWTTLFIGYSLLDYNLRLLFMTLRWKIDASNVTDMYSVDFRPDPLLLDVWDKQERYVKFIAEDVWAFVPKLYEEVLGKELSP